MMFPDRFLAHGKPEEQYKEAGLSAQHIENTIIQLIESDSKVKILKKSNLRIATKDPD